MTLRQLFYDRISGNFIAGFIGFFFCSLSTYINEDTYGVWDGPWPIIIGVTITTVWVTRLHALQESIRIKSYWMTKKLINHNQRILQRAFVAILIGSIIHLYTESINWHGIKLTLACAAYIGGIFWLIFDPILSHDRGRELFYVSKWYKSAWTDRIFKGDARLWLTSKLVIYVCGLWLYLKVFQG